MSKITEYVSNDNSLSTTCNIDKLTLLYNSSEPGKGITIGQDSIVSIQVTESLNTKLPIMKIKIMDGGLWYNTYLFEIGKNIRVTITPKKMYEDQVVQPYINCDYLIEGIEYVTDLIKKEYVYILTCVCGTEKYFNSICVWPKVQTISLTSDYSKTSKEVIQEIVNEAGLKFVSKDSTTPTDKMLWLCPNYTYKGFINKILNHSWYGVENCPIAYIDRDKNFILDTLNNLCKSDVKNRFKLYSLYGKELEKANIDKTKPSKYLTYSDLVFYNAGFIQNKIGYKIEAGQYNPFGDNEIETEINKKQLLDDTEENRYRKAEFSSNFLRLGKVSNKSTASRNNISTSTYTGMYFKDLHENYSIAPLHHTNMRNAFFTNYAMFTYDTSKQRIDGNQNSEYYPRLGDKIYIDASDEYNNNSIKSGNYLISGLTHVWVPNHAYTIAIQAVNDGVNSAGALSQIAEFENEKTKSELDDKAKR